jgi:hypothetical protein
VIRVGHVIRLIPDIGGLLFCIAALLDLFRKW